MNETMTGSTPWLLAGLRPSREDLARGRRKLHRKALGIGALTALSYWGLVLSGWAWPFRVGAAVALTHALVAVATGVMHDANHGSFSARRRTNRLVALTAELLGASGALWRHQHNDDHHRHTNVKDLDGDLEQRPVARLAPWQPRYRFHRFQHLYLWPLYALLAVKWFLVGDVTTLLSARHGRAGVGDWGRLLAGKALHLSWAVAVPLLLHPPMVVLGVYLVISLAVGFVLSVTFQLAHCVDAAEFLDAETEPLRGDAMVRHQLATTVDFEARTRIGRAYLSFLCGGLEYQVEHHLMPRVPHTLYPEIAGRLRALCAAEGLVHRDHGSVPAALRSHHRHLRAMGRAANPA